MVSALTEVNHQFLITARDMAKTDLPGACARLFIDTGTCQMINEMPLAQLRVFGESRLKFKPVFNAAALDRLLSTNDPGLRSALLLVSKNDVTGA